jgi:hypothetical protein
MTGLELIAAVREWLRRYVVLSRAQELTLALWCLHTWVYDRLGRTTPYVEITGVSGSGKTTLMEAMSLLSRGSVLLTTLRTLAMCRKIAETDGHVTFFVDEAERLEASGFGDQRSMLASGYRRGGEHMVSVGKETQMFPVWCPKVFTTLRTMTPVLHNRSIPIWLDRGTPVASLGNEWERAEATAAEIIERYKGVMRETPRFVTMEPLWLTSERDREIWQPLFSLALTLKVDKATLDELTAASVDLSALRGVERRMDARVEDEAAKERSYAVRLVQDVRSVLQPGETVIASRVLVERLRGLPTAPWRSYQRTGLTEVTLSQLLGAFGLESKDRRMGKGRAAKVLKGWSAADINAVVIGE